MLVISVERNLVKGIESRFPVDENALTLLGICPVMAAVRKRGSREDCTTD
jgi:hypothetical protein